MLYEQFKMFFWLIAIPSALTIIGSYLEQILRGDRLLQPCMDNDLVCSLDLNATCRHFIIADPAYVDRVFQLVNTARLGRGPAVFGPSKDPSDFEGSLIFLG